MSDVTESSEANSVPLPIARIIRSVAATLRQAGVDTPEHDAKLLIAEAAGVALRDVDKAMLVGDSLPFDMPRLKAMVSRRVAREPLQYIVGHAPFRFLDLAVGPGVFIPRPETELIVQEGLDWLASRHIDAPRVVDLCAGSGAIGLSVAAEMPTAEVWAVELSERTAAWARRNADAVLAPHGRAVGRYHLSVADATLPGTLEELDDTVDAVISNPPYVPELAVPSQPEVRDYDPELALYGGSSDGLAIPGLIIRRAFALLRDGGLLVMEHDITQGGALVAAAMGAGFTQVRTGFDYTHRPRYLVAVKGRQGGGQRA